MKAITGHQPYPSLIAAGFKSWEFREWAPPDYLIGQRIAIHAGVKLARRSDMQQLLLNIGKGYGGNGIIRHEEAYAFIDKALVSPGSLPYGVIVCTAVVGRPLQNAALAAALGLPGSAPTLWGWPLTGILPLSQPQPTVRGETWIWDYEGPV